MRPSTDDGVSCDLCFSVVLPALAKLRSDEVLVVGMVKINLASLAMFFLCLASTAASRLANICPHYRGYTAVSVPISAVLPRPLSPSPRNYRNSHPHYRSKHRGNHGITAVPIPVSIFNVELFKSLVSR